MEKPTIRFKGYTEDWEQRKLGDISSLITKGSTPKDKSGTGEVNFIKVENINDFSGDIVSMSKISLEEHQGYLKRSQLQEGDILFSIAGTLGRVTSVNKAILPANTNQALSIIRLKEGNLEYVKTCLKGNVVADFIRRNPTIGAQPNLSLEQVSNLEIEIPSEAEQEKIGLYFSNLDNLITLHQRISLYFFKINTFVWEQRKLGDSCKINGRIGFRGYTEKDIVTKEAGGVLTFSPTNIVDNKLTMECKNTYITREKYDESPEIKISNGDILFVKTGSTLGKSALVTGLKEDASINPQIVVMRVEKNTETFMSNILITNGVMKQVAAVKIGGAVPTMTETELKNFTYFAPAEKEEKKKIGDFFRTLDHLITLHQRKPYFWNKFIVIDWEQRKLNEIADKVSEKNKNNEFSEPFTNSAEQGIISQKDYFDREIVNNENLNGYYIVRNDDFIYNPRISATAPVGPINRNRLGRNGVMSPLYTVFRTHDIDNLYLEFYFKSTKWHRFMKLNGDSGARFDRFTISSTQFMEDRKSVV